MRFIRIFSSLLVLFSLMSIIVPGQFSPTVPPIKYTEYRLKNGLRVIMHEDNSVPIVAVNVWYHVGSKNEVLGKTGFAHLFEHMMFQGSKNYNNDYFKPLDAAGAKTKSDISSWARSARRGSGISEACATSSERENTRIR